MKTRILALLAVLVVVGGGAYAAMRLTAAPEDSAITLVPKDAVIYATVYIEPSSSQRSNLDSILTKLPRVDSLDKAKQELAELLDPVLSETGLTFGRDIEPWLGAQAAFFATVPEGETGSPDDVGVLIAAEDEEAARSAVERGIERAGDPNDWEDATYEGVAYRFQETDDSAFGFIDGYLVAGTESGFKAAVDASAGENLGDSERYNEATSLLTDDHLALAYFDSATIFDAAQDAGAMMADDVAKLGSFGVDAPTAVTLHAEEEVLVLESASQLPDEGPMRTLLDSYEAGSDLIGSFPADSWLALSLEDSGSTLDAAIDAVGSVAPGFDRDQIESEFSSATGLDLDDDVLSWMGDAGLFVQGRNLQEIGGALVIDSSDAGRSSAVVQKLQDLATSNGLQSRPLERDGLTGFSVQGPGMPAPINFLGGERFIAAYGDAATDGALAPDSTLADSDGYSAALSVLGDDYATLFYVGGEGLVRLIESGMSFSGTTDPAYEEDVKPYLDHLGFIVSGVRTESDRVLLRLAIGAR